MGIIRKMKKKNLCGYSNGIRCSSSGFFGTTASMSVGAKHRLWKRMRPTGAGEAAGSQHKPWSEEHREELVS